MAAKINQKEYLKKYLSGNVGEGKKKKKKKSKPVTGQSVKIIDDDFDLSQLQKRTDNDLEMFIAGEDAPQIVGVIDDRPPELVATQDYQKSARWRAVNNDDDSIVDVKPFDRIKREASDDFSPERRRDLSPVRRRDIKSKRRSDSSDNSPPRRHRSDKSPKHKKEPLSPRGNRFNDRYSNDLSPPRSNRRIKVEKSPDLSPERLRTPRYSGKDDDISPPRRIKRKLKSRTPSPVNRKAVTTLDGKMAGLQNAKSLRDENDKFKRREAEMLDRLSASGSGRHSEMVVRERKTGRRRNYDDPVAEQAKLQREKERKEVYDRWGKGLKQVEDHQKKIDEYVHEANKPLARYSDDQDLDRLLRDQERAGDPMLEYMRSKEVKRNQEAGGKVLPTYKGTFPENRFNIRPGYRWDGVDRSNGYEIKWFDVQSRKKAGEEEAYKYSIEDM